MTNSNFCNKVITIPQYEPTCWFNVILMAILYSQYSRKLLLNDKVFNSKNNKLTKILKHILKYQYVSNEYAEQYFNIMTPGKILKYFGLIDDFYKSIVNNGWFSDIFLPIFIQKACFKTAISLDLYNNNIYIEYYKKTRIINIIEYGKNKGVQFLNDNITDYDLQQHILSILSQPNPDYLIINIGHETINGYNSDYLKVDANRIDYIINLNTYNIITSGIKELKDVITYNGDTYLLDSCIIGNYNADKLSLGHAIVGIKCKNDKYVYNGWIRTTNDPAMLIGKDVKKADNDNSKLLPCELMKFDWNITDYHNSFCINMERCKLDMIDVYDRSKEHKELCFSFGKSKRTLIYVKQTKQHISSVDTNIMSSNTNITFPSSSSVNIFADVKDNKKDLKKNIKDIIKNVKLKKLLLKELKKLRERESQLKNDIKELQKLAEKNT